MLCVEAFHLRFARRAFLRRANCKKLTGAFVAAGAAMLRGSGYTAGNDMRYRLRAIAQQPVSAVHAAPVFTDDSVEY